MAHTASGEVKAYEVGNDSNVHFDRVASPWVIKRFIDPDAEFSFVPRNDTDSRPPDAIPVAIPEAMLGVATTADGARATVEPMRGIAAATLARVVTRLGVAATAAMVCGNARGCSCRGGDAHDD